MEKTLESQLDIPLIYGRQNGIAAYLETIVPHLRSLSHWEEIFGEYVIRPIQQWATQCQQLYGERQEWKAWWREFASQLPAVFDGISRDLAASQQPVSDQVRAHLTGAGYPQTGESLSRMAQNVLLHLDGVSSVLNGMRRPDYVADSMGATELESVDSPSILRNFSELQQPAGGTQKSG